MLQPRAHALAQPINSDARLALFQVKISVLAIAALDCKPAKAKTKRRIYTMRKSMSSSIQMTAILLALCVAGCFVAECLGRPLPNERRKARQERATPSAAWREARNRRSPFNDEANNSDTYNDEHFQHDSGTTNSQQPTESCYVNVTEYFTVTEYNFTEDGTMVKTRVNKTRDVRKCCPGWSGTDCNVRPPPIPIDPIEPCKGQKCEGSDSAVCMTISKCGRSLPVFYEVDGPEFKVARCTNGQPIDVNSLLCPPACTLDPCKGERCPAHPNAVCTVSKCDCQPMWLLIDSGVEVDCDSGDALPPKSERRRRRSSENDASSSNSTSSGNCTLSNSST